MAVEKILVVVDMQKDFIDGTLGTKEAIAITDNVLKKIITYKEYEEKNPKTTKIFATRDTHDYDYMKTQEGKNLPVEHCIEGTPGWQIDSKLSTILNDANAEIIDKPSFGSVVLAQRIRELADTYFRQNGGTLDFTVEFVGLCTDICVVSNVLMAKAFSPEIKMIVDSSCCAGVTPEKHLAALETMRSCQVEII